MSICHPAALAQCYPFHLDGMTEGPRVEGSEDNSAAVDVEERKKVVTSPAHVINTLASRINKNTLQDMPHREPGQI